MTPDEREAAREYWRDIIYTPDGALDEDAVLRELIDYKFILEQVPLVYDALTGGLLSKPTYYARDVISAAETYTEGVIVEARAEAFREAAEMIENGAPASDLLANVEAD